MDWYKFYVKDDVLDLQRNIRVRLEFADVWTKLGAPIGLALFELIDEPIGGSTYYSPAPVEPVLKQFLERYSAEPCDKPDGSQLKSVIGGTKDWEYWFYRECLKISSYEGRIMLFL